MPQVPKVEGQPSKARVMIQPPPEQIIEAATPAPIPIPSTPKVPEAPPPIPIPKSQAELAVESIAQQNIRKRNEMVPSIPNLEDKGDELYKFTDTDRKAAAISHWGDKFDWEASSLDEALEHLAAIRAECERGGIILQKRVSEVRLEIVKCFSCDNKINISEGRWAGMRTRNNFETGLPESAYSCSARCAIIMNREFSHPSRVAVREA